LKENITTFRKEVQNDYRTSGNQSYRKLHGKNSHEGFCNGNYGMDV
jgi:hypothetical protein